MTIKDREVVEALRAEPELLALADALQSPAAGLTPPCLCGVRVRAGGATLRSRSPPWLR
jgi:hypothetical protein